MQRLQIDKIAGTPEDRVLLAKLWDKIHCGIRKNIPANTAFLSLREQTMAQYLFGSAPGLHAFGGFPEAERKMLLYLPDYLQEDYLYGPDSPVFCIRAEFYREDALSHRDFLGALIGAGISRDCVGDICPGKGVCDFFVTKEIAPFLLEQLESAGRTKLQLKQIPLCDAVIPQPETKEIRDTVASLRLDSIVASGFSLARSAAAQAIVSGKAFVDGMPCDKPDKTVAQGAKISLRGQGKIQLMQIGGQTKKGRIGVVIHRYV